MTLQTTQLQPSNAIDIDNPIDIIDGIRIYIAWQLLDDSYRKLVSDFWLANNAITDKQEALRRTQEVVCFALNQQGDIAGVSTVYTAPFGKEKKSYYFFRTFIKRDCRKLGLALRFVKYTHAHLAQNAQLTVSASKAATTIHGMVIITENLRLKLSRINRWLKSQGFELLGLMPDKKEVWKIDFPQ